MTMLSTGSNFLRKHERGMTLFEVLISVVILATSLLAVYRPLFGSIGALYEAESRVSANRVISNQIWAFQDEFRRTGRIPAGFSGQLVTEQNRAFYLTMSYRPLYADKKLYEALARISWQNGAREKTLSRMFYVSAY